MVSERTNEVKERIAYFAFNYDFAKKTAEEYLDSAMFFAKKGNDQAYEHCIANAAEWFGIKQTWIDVARREKCYIVD